MAAYDGAIAGVGIEATLAPGESRDILNDAITRTGTDPHGFSPHSLRAGFVTWAHLLGQPDRAIAAQTGQRSLASIGTYVRIQEAWTANAAIN